MVERLADVLVEGVTEAEFVAALNRRVYLFPALGAAHKLINAYRQRGRQIVLSFPLPRLLDEAADLVEVSRYNTGRSAAPEPAKGPDQFLPLRCWPGGTSKEITFVSPRLSPDQLDRLLLSVDTVPGPA